MSTQSRFKAALEMRDFGIMLKRQSLRRQDPSASAEAIEERVRAWLLETRVGDGLTLSDRLVHLH